MTRLKGIHFDEFKMCSIKFEHDKILNLGSIIELNAPNDSKYYFKVDDILIDNTCMVKYNATSTGHYRNTLKISCVENFGCFMNQCRLSVVNDEELITKLRN